MSNQNADRLPGLEVGDAPAAPSRAERNERGQFVRGNVAAVKTGRYAKGQLPEALEALDALSRDFLEQSIEDDGGRAALSARRISQHENRAIVWLMTRRLALSFDAHGMHSRDGKLRVAWLQQLGTMLAKATEIDRLLGLDRRAKSVTDLHDYLSQPAAGDAEDRQTAAVDNRGLSEPPAATDGEG